MSMHAGVNMAGHTAWVHECRRHSMHLKGGHAVCQEVRQVWRQGLCPWHSAPVLRHHNRVQTEERVLRTVCAQEAASERRMEEHPPLVQYAPAAISSAPERFWNSDTVGCIYSANLNPINST